MAKLMSVLFLALAVVVTAQAETLYTSLQETPVRDRPLALGSTIIAKLKAGSMIETVKEAGAFTAISFIQGGKVRTGFVATSQIRNSPDGAKPVGAVEAAQTSVGAEDIGAMVNGLSDQAPTVANAKVTELPETFPAGAEDPEALLTSKLDSMQIPSASLEQFARSGKLVSRGSKAKGQ